jgi:hypothetical protein
LPAIQSWKREDSILRTERSGDPPRTVAQANGASHNPWISEDGNWVWTFVLEEREHGGRLPVELPLGALARAVGALGVLGLGALGLALLIDPTTVNHSWPWMLTPLVGRLLGVWFASLAVAYAWALADGDWLRARPIFLQGPPTGALILLVPALRGGEFRSGVAHLGVFVALVAFLLGGGLLASIAGERGRSRAAL